MTPKQVTTIDLKDLKEIELRCECGGSIRLPLPLKNLIAEQGCPACPRPMWEYQGAVRHKLANLLEAIRDWNSSGYKDLALRFVLTEESVSGN